MTTRRKHVSQQAKTAKPLPMKSGDTNDQGTTCEDFVAYMMEITGENDDDNSFKNEYRGVLPILNEHISIYEAGRAGTVPHIWAAAHEIYEKKRADPDLKQYYELKEKCKDNIAAVKELEAQWLSNYSDKNPQKTDKNVKNKKRK